ncbi:MAG: PA0069 family radical SAM protein [Burkholderiales bacterium]|nr:PA0069 family radical SAM protein [Burkholderiales bacterium]
MPLKTHSGARAGVKKGRGATANPEGRFERVLRESDEDGQRPVAPSEWAEEFAENTPPLKTFVSPERARSIIAHNDSPDIPFSQSINPYRGCEHGCIYCYARPSHAYLDLSPGLDFETRLFAKQNGAELLRAELSRPGYRCELIALGANTDPYQPIERDWQITRQILQVCAEFNQPVAIITKSARIERDLDILSAMAGRQLVQVFVSVTTLDHDLARRLEPRASAPARRMQALCALNKANVPCGVMVAPVIPFLTDSAMEQILAAAGRAGAAMAGYALLRLPYEVKSLFKAWLVEHYPLKAEHVMSRVAEMRDGRENDSEFGRRMRGQGEFAQLLAQRFRIACQRSGLNERRFHLNVDRFRVPTTQLALF